MYCAQQAFAAGAHEGAETPWRGRLGDPTEQVGPGIVPDDAWVVTAKHCRELELGQGHVHAGREGPGRKQHPVESLVVDMVVVEVDKWITRERLGITGWPRQSDLLVARQRAPDRGHVLGQDDRRLRARDLQHRASAEDRHIGGDPGIDAEDLRPGVGRRVAQDPRRHGVVAIVSLVDVGGADGSVDRPERGARVDQRVDVVALGVALELALRVGVARQPARVVDHAQPEEAPAGEAKAGRRCEHTVRVWRQPHVLAREHHLGELRGERTVLAGALGERHHPMGGDRDLDVGRRNQQQTLRRRWRRVGWRWSRVVVKPWIVWRADVVAQHQGVARVAWPIPSSSTRPQP
ncbi:MAG: hypothetical protein IPL61_22850 [Myxococcales bacterium]|nr:hypothetical protein [Myxococcales bacterium]